jgi:hypothetical protein
MSLLDSVYAERIQQLLEHPGTPNAPAMLHGRLFNSIAMHETKLLEVAVGQAKGDSPVIDDRNRWGRFQHLFKVAR